MQGKMIIVSAPSGSGKTTIVKEILHAGFNIRFSVSACSRSPRQNETNGRDYYFLTVEEFKQKIAEDAFLEWEEVYEGNYYGTLKSEVERIWNLGSHVIFDVDVKGGLNIKRKYPENSLALFIQAPSLAELEKRLRNRMTETEETIRKRLEKAAWELTFAPEFDLVIVNDRLEDAVHRTLEAVRDFLDDKS